MGINMDRVRTWQGSGLLALTLLVATPLAAQTALPAAPAVPLELQTGARCAALFALVSADQARGGSESAGWPPLAQRGREFFVRISARIMDAAGLDRAGIGALMQGEVRALEGASPARRAARAALKAPCLALLDATRPAGS